MNMIVCIKQVLDPEAPLSSFKIDPATNTMVPVTSVPFVISPFDEQAVEAALKIKDAKGGKITVISLGVNLLRDVVKKPLSLGADELILLEDPAFIGGDSWSTAYALARPLKRSGNSTSSSAAVRLLTRIPVRSVPVSQKYWEYRR
jgi:electron transfer flavoprotein beta subunit